MNRSESGRPVVGCSRFIATLSLLVLSGGCRETEKPRLRFGAFWGSPIGMEFARPDHLGSHSFGFSLNEKNGMVYTCRGGFIDIAHVREAADRTAYLQKVAYRNIVRGNKRFSFRVIEPSQYWVTLSYPRDWSRYSQQEKEATAKKVSIHLGQHLAHKSLIWHEIVTWYGFATAGILPDTISAFSWEDTYSDVLGTQLAAMALCDERRRYDEAVTELLSQRLKELSVQPIRVARAAARKVDGRWYTGGLYFLVDMKRRNLDVGLDDGRITPWLVPGICPDAEPRPCPVPSLEPLCRHGFSFDVEIEPRVREKNKIYHSIGLPKNHRIEPQVDFPSIMAIIEERENGLVVSAAVR